MVSSYYIPILNKTRTDTSTVLIYADTLVQVSSVNGKVKTLKMVRENHKAMKGAGIIGSWILENSDAESATMTYTPEGKFELHKVLRSFNGNFVVNKDTVSVYSNGIPMMKSHFLFERGKLLLYSNAKSGYVKLQRIKK